MDIRLRRRVKRNDLANKFKELGFNKGVEIGVCHGTFSKVLCEVNPELELKSIDPYKVISDEPWTNQEHIKKEIEGLFQQATELLKPYNCELIRKTSLEAVVDFPYDSIDFVYIDGSHIFDYVMTDIIEWTKRVKSGGIVAGHDYSDSYPDVKLAVNTYLEAHKYPYINLTDELAPSWWFIKK